LFSKSILEKMADELMREGELFFKSQKQRFKYKKHG
jgi:hypothetical protein